MEASRMHETGPLVSVVIRSLGRPSLARSVTSVVEQRHRPLEIVVVNAGAYGISLPETSAVPVRVIEGGPYDRPAAANAGLLAARGEWIAFLDDDDAFHPDHIESLLQALRASDGALLAYSATRCLDTAGNTASIIDVAFDRLKLFSLNYIQIGAALFSRTLVLEGCRFDENFECLQDWDFWLQLAQRTHFAHTGEATNLWSAYGGGSGCGLGPNSDRDQFERYSQLLSRKWKSTGVALQHKIDHHNRLARQALGAGLADKADAHMVIAERLLRGPARSPAQRVATTRRPMVAGRITRESSMTGC